MALQYKGSVQYKCVINPKSICCENIPDVFLDKSVARNYFSQFGRINRFILRPKYHRCTVEYELEEHAEKAFKNCGTYNGHSFTVNYVENEVVQGQNSEEWLDPEIEAELEAMGTSRRQNLDMNQALKMSLETGTRLHQPSFSFSVFKPIKSAVENQFPSQQPQLHKIDSTVHNDLEIVMKSAAFNEEDKYRILDARDKLIRFKSIRQTDIKMAVSTKGTCPDMCPEKERLMRDFQRQVSSFEILIGTSSIDHRKAIKEYSRSSADQEMPLSHELRPENVLNMTMQYLMQNIMNLCEDPQTSLGEWFHFVWDRTRSIRKDITQQELCSPKSVQLIEQCARFHIHCAARLVAEDPSVFDKKINAENLTKCLQSLKYMYHDLRIKNILCPREAEFRSYIILLNLGDSNFLWELKQLPEEIQNSVEIKQALSFYNAVQNNNYVRFFNLIRSEQTSYLSACILLGYFTKLRLRAMEAIIKAHLWRKNDILPLEYLERILGFENKEYALDFFNYHGLQSNGNRVYLDRLRKPEIEYSMHRAHEMVESKRLVSVGECICGGPLSSTNTFENHKPHNSFDVNGFLMLESWSAEDQTKYHIKVQQMEKPIQNDTTIFKIPQTSFPFTLKQSSSPTRTPRIDILNNKNLGDRKKIINFGNTSDTTNSAIKNLYLNHSKANVDEKDFFWGNRIKQSASESNVLFLEEIDESTKNANNDKIESDNMSKDVKSDNIFGIISKSCEHLYDNQIGIQDKVPKASPSLVVLSNSDINIKNINNTEELAEQQKSKRKELDDENNKLKILEKKQKEADVKYQKNLIRLELDIENITEEILITVIKDELNNVSLKILSEYEMLNRASDFLLKHLISNIIPNQIEDIASEEYAIICYDHIILKRYFEKWFLYVQKKKHKKKIMDTFPIWVNTNSPSEQLNKINHPQQEHNLQYIKRYRYGEPCNFTKLLWENPLLQTIPEKLNLNEFILKNYKTKEEHKWKMIGTRKYIKFIFSLPSEMDELPGFQSLCSFWLKKYIKVENMAKGYGKTAFACNLKNDVALCIRKINGIVTQNNINIGCDNSDAIVFFLTPNNLQLTRKRLYSIFQFSKFLRPIPISFITYNCQLTEHQLFDALELKEFMLNSQMSTYQIWGNMILKEKFCFPIVLRKSLKYLLQVIDIENGLEMQALQSWLNDVIGGGMWYRWENSYFNNPAFAKVCSVLKYVIDLYNEAIHRLKNIVMKDLSKYSNFPEEFLEFVSPIDNKHDACQLEHFPLDWKEKKRQEQVFQLLDKFQLPSLQENSLYPTSLENYKSLIVNYISLVISNDEQKSIEISYFTIKSLIDQLNCADLKDLNVNERIKYVNFLPVIKEFVFLHIQNIMDELRNELPEEVIYHGADLHEYLTHPWWLNINSIQNVIVDYSLEETTLLNCGKKNFNNFGVETCKLNFEKIIKNAEELSEKIEMKEKTIRQYVGKNKELDRTLYNFELAKRKGHFDYSFINNISDDLKTKNTHTPSEKKRKRTESFSEVDAVIDTALNLISKLENVDNLKLRIMQ